jgi:hypothetical protein
VTTSRNWTELESGATDGEDEAARLVWLRAGSDGCRSRVVNLAPVDPPHRPPPPPRAGGQEEEEEEPSRLLPPQTLL